MSIDQQPIASVDLLARICLLKNWAANESDAQELAEKWDGQFLNYLRRELNQQTEFGRFSPYSFNSSSDYLVQGCAFVEPQDNEEVKSVKSRRKFHGRYWDVLGKLQPRQFEAMCAGIVQMIGVESPVLTKYSADEGIDFYGRLRLEKFLLREQFYPNVHRQISVWMIGQAKHYDKCQVSTSDIRDLVGAVHLARGGAFGSIGPKYQDLIIRACDPIFHLFVTTGHLSSNCWRLLQKSGVLGMDGEMVSAFLADHGVGVSDSGFVEAELIHWISGFDCAIIQEEAE